ncbi:MAG: carbohydrate ABC transporter substrate-binding protein [Ruminococcus sp.]|nr:carbohydrate ABC transporter substrate-binding protein [Ruminococcus sp.]
MNTLKKTLALVATLAMAATAFASCGSESSSSTASSSSSSAEESKAEDSAAEDSSAEDSAADSSAADTPIESTGEIDASVGQGGDKFTVAAWNADDVPYLIAQWKGIDYSSVADDLANGKVEGIDFINFGVGGGDASEKYDNLFSAGSDLDVYFCEADWALKYINDDSKTLALDKLGLGDSDFANIYSYTDEIGKTTSGVRKGVSWQAAAGGFYYRSDLAADYLGATTPEEMQAQISDWDKFVTAAQTVNEKSGGKTALADTLGGMWQAYACGRTTPWVKDNTLQIDDFCQKFADTAKALWDCGGITKNSQWSDEWTAAGTNDSCMGYFVSTWGFGGFALDAAGGEGGATYGKWAVCQGPQPFYWGGTWIVVNPATDNGQEARDFILSATSDEAAMSTYATNKPEYVNNSKVMDDLISSDTVFNQKITDNMGGQNFYAALADNAKTINFNGLITEYDATIKQQFIDAVKTQYLEGGASWDETVDEFKNLIADKLPSLDIED